MSFMTGSSKSSYQPEMTGNTTTSSYWLNWRVALCAVWIVSCMVAALVMIWKKEDWKTIKNNQESHEEEESKGILYADETWKPCLKEIHPAWLLAYRVTAFFLLLALLIANAIVDTGSIFYYYTQWTFTLVTIYFGLGSLLSIYGCSQYRNRVSGDRSGSDAEQGIYVAPTTRRETTNVFNIEKNAGSDSEQGIYVAPITRRETTNGFNIEKNPVAQEQGIVRQTAGIWGYIFQVIFQMNAGAVMLTDFVFWFIIVPFLAIKDYELNFLLIGMHSINAVFLLGDTALNCLRFPWFRIAYFILWTCVFVVFQWLVHACISIWWPYPFLDLSSSYAPIWYMVVGFMHLPCYALFALVVKMKHYLWMKWFPQSYQCRQ